MYTSTVETGGCSPGVRLSISVPTLFFTPLHPCSVSTSAGGVSGGGSSGFSPGIPAQGTLYRVPGSAGGGVRGHSPGRTVGF